MWSAIHPCGWRQHPSRAVQVSLLGVALVGLTACNAKLPEPDSPGAKVYASRCSSGCHRLFAPGSLTYEMWKLQVERMQGEFVRRGLPPLSAQERALVLDYLKRHSSSGLSPAVSPPGRSPLARSGRPRTGRDS
jgi:hypothetical protein